jgi:hypothetical protein
VADIQEIKHQIRGAHILENKTKKERKEIVGAHSPDMLRKRKYLGEKDPLHGTYLES